jgi:transcriptional regulator with XRE-family HTH domain
MKTRRDEAGYSFTDLSEKTGINKSQLSRIESGQQRQMTAGNFFAICEALALDPMFAWYGESRRQARQSEPPPASSRRASRPPTDRR